jgi:hypothetical protein
MSSLKTRLMASGATEIKSRPEVTIPADEWERRIRKATPTERALFARDTVTGLTSVYPFNRRLALAAA